MSQFTDTRIVEVLELAVSQSRSIQHMYRSGPDYLQWKRDTRNRLSNIFGEDSKHIHEFNAILEAAENPENTIPDHYGTPTRTISDYERPEIFKKGLEHARILLRSLITEIQDFGSGESETPSRVCVELKEALKAVPGLNNQLFLAEAVECFERRLYRAAVVLSWAGAMDFLYSHVTKNHLQAFNTEALRRNSKWRAAKTKDDLARMKEFEFLNVLEAISLIGRNVKQELQNSCLKLRNACAHPSSLRIGENRVAAHLEVLILNVFSAV